MPEPEGPELHHGGGPANHLEASSNLCLSLQPPKGGGGAKGATAEGVPAEGEQRRESSKAGQPPPSPWGATQRVPQARSKHGETMPFTVQQQNLEEGACGHREDAMEPQKGALVHRRADPRQQSSRLQQPAAINVTPV